MIQENIVVFLPEKCKGRIMKIAFGSVTYKNAWNYRAEFMESLNKQTMSEFDLLIINDNVENINELKELTSLNLIIVDKPYAMSIAELRIFLLDTAKRLGYDLLILGDFDDKFHENRIEHIAGSYNGKIGFYYNPLQLFNNHTVFENLPQEVNSYENILEYNFLGLSNTAINLNFMSSVFINSLNDGNTAIFDWYLYTRLLLEGIKGVLVDDAITYYRIYENNLAGIEITDLNSIKKEIKIKLEHYKLLKAYDSSFLQKYEQYSKLSLNNYTQCLSHETNGYWWNKIHVQ